MLVTAPFLGAAARRWRVRGEDGERAAAPSRHGRTPGGGRQVAPIRPAGTERNHQAGNLPRHDATHCRSTSPAAVARRGGVDRAVGRNGQCRGRSHQTVWPAPRKSMPRTGLGPLPDRRRDRRTGRAHPSAHPCRQNPSFGAGRHHRRTGPRPAGGRGRAHPDRSGHPRRACAVAHRRRAETRHGHYPLPRSATARHRASRASRHQRRTPSPNDSAAAPRPRRTRPQRRAVRPPRHRAAAHRPGHRCRHRPRPTTPATGRKRPLPGRARSPAQRRPTRPSRPCRS